jgi:hypothetical protein
MIFEEYQANLPTDHSPNLRILTRAYTRHLGLERDGDTECWRELLAITIHESSQVTVETPALRLANVESIAADLRTKYGNGFKKILPKWKKLTGQGKTAYYEALERIDKRRS